MEYTSKEVYEYISKKTDDKIVERKTCRLSGQKFPIYQTDLEFYAKVSPKFEVSPEYAKQFLAKNSDIAENFEYEVDEKTGKGKLKCKIPTPTLCPEERQRRRLAFRNERKLYKRKCDFSGKEIISIYSPDKLYKVYDQKIWWSDKWDALDYRKEINLEKTAYNIISDLVTNIPRLNLMAMENENSIYTNYTGWSKNTYMCNDVMFSEDIYYSNIIKKSNYCLDLTDSKNCEKSAYLVHCQNMYNSCFCYDCENCNNSMFLENSTNCENCLFSYSLHGKKNYLFNKKATTKEIAEIKQKIRNNKANEEINKWNKFIKNKKYIATNTTGSEMSYGNLLFNSKSSSFYFDSYEIKNCKYGMVGDNNIDCQDNSICNPNNYFSYELISGGEQKQSSFNIACGHSNAIYFSHLCFYSSNLFGCVGLRNKEYCIFNKQYTKEEYNQLVPKIIARMMRDSQRGEFFDPQLSPFGYNETVAMEYYPFTKEEALKLGYKRSDYEAPFPKVEKYVQGKKLRTASCKLIHEQKPELLEKLLNYAVICEVSQRPFRIIKQEIDFYIKHDLPLPRKHPDIRHQERIDKRPGRTLFLRNCDKCGEEVLSVYPTASTLGHSHEGADSLHEDRFLPVQEGQNRSQEGYEEIQNSQQIYCEKCYQQEIYG